MIASCLDGTGSSTGPRNAGRGPHHAAMLPIAVVGSLNIDLVWRVGRFPAPGENVFTRSFEVLVGGGKGGNQAVALGRLGAQVRLVGMLGSDLRGPEYRAVLARHGVDTRGVGEVAGLPGLGLVAVDDQGENLIFVHPGANGLVSEAHVAANWPNLADCGLVLLQNEIPLASNRAALALARRHGQRVILDPAPATADLPTDLLAGVDWLTPNRSELATLSGLPTATADGVVAAARSLLARGVRTVIAKCGSAGAWIVEAAGVTQVAPFPVVAVDPTAAGDTFNAGFAYGLAAGWDLPCAVRFACAAAAITCTAVGAQTAMPDRQQVERLLAGTL